MRLTTKINIQPILEDQNTLDFETYVASYCENNAVARKLGELEDLMEKYHCNDIVDLENRLQENTELKKKLENKQKFKKGQKVCFFDEYDNKVYSEWGTFIMTDSKTAIVDCRYGMFEISLDDIFATVTEAEQRLKEFKGE